MEEWSEVLVYSPWENMSNKSNLNLIDGSRSIEFLYYANFTLAFLIEG